MGRRGARGCINSLFKRAAARQAVGDPGRVTTTSTCADCAEQLVSVITSMSHLESLQLSCGPVNLPETANSQLSVELGTLSLDDYKCA